jgi:hypothetical protein
MKQAQQLAIAQAGHKIQLFHPELKEERLTAMNFFFTLLCTASTVVATTPVPGIQRFLASWDKSPLASYPTDFTRGIIPVSTLATSFLVARN